MRWHLLMRRAAATSNFAQERVGQGALPPTRFELRQNAPNPFAATTDIGFDLPTEAHVKIEIFDLLGRRIRTLADRSWNAGRHSVRWDRTTERGERLSSGVFLCRMTADGFRDQKRMVLVGR